MNSPLKFSLSRWLELIGYAFVGAILFVCGQPLLLKLSGWLETAVPSTSLRMAVLLTTGGFCLWKLNTLLDVRLQHFRYFMRYPPTVIAIPVALLIAGLLPSVRENSEHFANNDLVTLSVCLAIYIVLLAARLCIQHLNTSKAHKSPASADFPTTLQDLPDEGIYEWMEREEPIKTSVQDYFGLIEKVDRIVSALKSSSSQTVALVGGFGCGKSSLVNLVELRSTPAYAPRLLFCKVSCWGFEDSAAAQEVILNQAIARLGEETDCFRLRGLPARYVRALSKTSGALEIVLQLSEERQDPLLTLQQFTPLLSAINAKLVVVIEDADRNGEKFDISHIQALLQRFRQIEGLSFIICAGPNTGVAFAKLCEHIETIPDLDEKEVLLVAERVQKICQKKYPQDIDPHPHRRPLNDPMNRIKGSLWMSTYISWQSAIARLMRTPRMLKRTLLRFSLAWNRLHGEVDIDELMMFCCLRVCVPRVFEFICQHNTVLGNLAHHNRDNFEQKDKEDQIKRISTLWASVEFETEVDREAAAAIVQKLYPASEAVFKIRSYSQDKSFQGIDHRGAVNYFERLVSEDVLPSQVRDQRVFRLIYNANDDEHAISALAKAIVSSSDFARTFEQHSRTLRDERLFKLATTVYAAIRSSIGSEADSDSNGFCEIWRVVRNRMRWLPEYANWPIGEIEPCLPRHIKLLTDIYRLWYYEEDRAPKRIFRKALWRAMKSKFQNTSPSEFIAAFDRQYPFTLFHLVFTSEFDKTPKPPVIGYRFWKWLAPILLESVKASPTQFVPQVAILLQLKTPGGQDPKQPIDFQFDHKLLENFFGNLKYDLLTELSKRIESQWDFDPQLNTQLSLMHERASQLLNQITSTSTNKQ